MCNLIIYEVTPLRSNAHTTFFPLALFCNCQFCAPKLTCYVPFVPTTVRNLLKIRHTYETMQCRKVMIVNIRTTRVYETFRILFNHTQVKNEMNHICIV